MCTVRLPTKHSFYTYRVFDVAIINHLYFYYKFQQSNYYTRKTTILSQ